MDVRITKPVQGGKIKAIASKSEAHRLLICAALADSETIITCIERSEDIDATVRCLKALGANIKYVQDKFFVMPINRELQKKKEYVLDCGESGATLRFLLPICGALGAKASFYMNGRLPSRPLSELYNAMTSHGITLSEADYSPLKCEGQLKSGEYELAGNISSQFISGLLFALPLLSRDSAIRVSGVLESRPYVDMTLDALRRFGVTIFEEEKQCFHIPGRQTGFSPKNLHVEGDWSNAAFWLAAGAIGKNSITCTGLNLNSCQGDSAIAVLLERFGAHVSYKNDSVTVSSGTLRGMDIDARDTPDLVPVLAAVASVAYGKTTIRNAGRLRIKESDRLHTIAASLTNLGANIIETDDGLIITGNHSLSGGETPSYGDHRIAMTAAILATVCTKPVVIQNAEAVNKSYPRFFKDYTALGGVCNYHSHSETCQNIYP